MDQWVKLKYYKITFGSQAKPSSESHYFNDGVKRIDMILAYQDENDKTRAKKKREVFEKLLKEQGLELETEYKTVSDFHLQINRAKAFQIEHKIMLWIRNSISIQSLAKLITINQLNVYL